MAPEGTKPIAKPPVPKGKEAAKAPNPEPMDTKSEYEEDEEVTLLKATVQEMKEQMAANAEQTEERMQQLAEYAKANQEALAGEAQELRDRLAEATQRMGEQAEGYDKRIREMQQLNQRAAAGGKDPGEVLRPSAPEQWDGNAAMLQGFLTQLRTFFHYYPLQFDNNAPAMVTYATGRMKGAALQWMEPYLREYNQRRDDSSAATIRLFHHYAAFETTLKETFGRIDEEREIEMKLRSLKQIGSASKYIAELRQLLSHLGDVSNREQMTYLYQGLKEEVKDELCKEDRPSTFNQYAAMAVKIDDRIYQRRLERGRGRNNNAPRPQQHRFQPRNHYQPNSGRHRSTPTAYGTQPGPMELDAKVCKAPRRNGKKFRPVPKGSPKNLSAMEQGKTLAVAQQEVDTTYGTQPGPMDLDEARCPECKMTLAVAYKGYDIPDNEQDWRKLAKGNPEKYKGTCVMAVRKVREERANEKELWFKGYWIPQEEYQWRTLESTGNAKLYNETCIAAIELARTQAAQKEKAAWKELQKDWQWQDQIMSYGPRQRRRTQNLCVGLATPEKWDEYEEAWTEGFPENNWVMEYFAESGKPAAVHPRPTDWEPVPEGRKNPQQLDRMTLAMASDAYDSDGHVIDSEEERYWQRQRGASLQEEIIPSTPEDSEDDISSNESSATQEEIMADDKYGLISTYFRTNIQREPFPEIPGEHENNDSDVESINDETMAYGYGLNQTQFSTNDDRQIHTKGDQEIMEKSRQRRDPGGAHHDLFVPALQIEEAMKYVDYEPWRHEEDNTQLDIDHEWHEGLSWVSCYWIRCPKHLGEKVKNNAFPIKSRRGPTTEPYEYAEVVEHEVTTYYPHEKIAKLERSRERYPIECYELSDGQQDAGLYNCVSMFCELHREQKLSAWQHLRWNLGVKLQGHVEEGCRKKKTRNQGKDQRHL
ncbi:hypothetical protein S7711_09999 [Stachybotrys chartarum IBT 7711]|uniref:Retrotransposon gag domain-containing protein n=1 Tax=Stachybotrys chartarum (strain CBS 109288 / IBT 7711) TaxID=1280523 RepID=A0A084B7W2_STACB|nr:hypothetical protein S7711_09999 [Stachybotrys chartarum IBT 7711]